MLRVSLLACLVASPCIGADPFQVYTNADLERLGPVPGTAQEPIAHLDPEAFRMMSEYLDREHGRIREDRAAELERARVAVEQDAARSAGHRYSLPIGYGYYGYHGPYGYNYGDTHPHRQAHRQDSLAPSCGKRPGRSETRVPIMHSGGRPPHGARSFPNSRSARR